MHTHGEKLWYTHIDINLNNGNAICTEIPSKHSIDRQGAAIWFTIKLLLKPSYNLAPTNVQMQLNRPRSPEWSSLTHRVSPPSCGSESGPDVCKELTAAHRVSDSLSHNVPRWQGWDQLGQLSLLSCFQLSHEVLVPVLGMRGGSFSEQISLALLAVASVLFTFRGRPVSWPWLGLKQFPLFFAEGEKLNCFSLIYFERVLTPQKWKGTWILWRSCIHLERKINFCKNKVLLCISVKLFVFANVKNKVTPHGGIRRSHVRIAEFWTKPYSLEIQTYGYRCEPGFML